MTNALPPILAVEDASDDVLFTRRALSKAKVPNPLVWVGDGEDWEASLCGKSSTAGRGLPALVRMDVGLPDLSGLELLEWIRKQRDLARVQMGMLRASESARHLNRACEAGRGAKGNA